MPWDARTGGWPASREILEQLFVHERRSYSEIADLFGTTRNAVAGRCHRLGLVSNDGVGGYAVQRRREEERSTKEPRGCRWIHGDLGDDGWTYCQAPRRPGSSYCENHHRRVFVRRGP
ncbi:MAG TPA: GcrA family cell cycle regulator [Azospirillum sp.]|nr:GcrA family cell cycle regulator [Azospirillum sp.]